MIYIGIVGSTLRNERLKIIEILSSERSKHKVITAVTGGAVGIDEDVRKACKVLGIPLLTYFPKLDEYPIKGDDIYFERNESVAIKSNYMHAFPLGKRCGTTNTINHFIRLGKEKKLKIYV